VPTFTEPRPSPLKVSLMMPIHLTSSVADMSPR
jgi:hypothetical protein